MFHTVLGDRKSVKELAQIYEEFYGVTPIVECQVSLDDLYKNMKAAHQKEPANVMA